MRLLAFCDYYSPDSCGGAERVAREVYIRLAREHGVDVTVVGTGPRRGERTARHSVGAAGVGEVYVPGVDLSHIVGAQLTLSKALPRTVRGLVRSAKPVVMHANSLHFHSTIVAARLAKRFGIPLVTTVHLGSLDALPLRMRVGARIWDETIGRSIVRATSHMVAVSENVAEYAASLGADPARISVAYNGVDHDIFHAMGRRARSGPLRIGFVGRLIANKGPQVLLDALIDARAGGLDFDAVFLGDGPMRAHLEARASAAGLDEHVRFAGQVTDVATQLRQLDVVVRPSYTEGLPLAVIESMACGAVVVCSDVAGNVELVDDGVTGMVFPVGRHDLLSAHLRRLAEDDSLLLALGDKAIARADEFSWDASARVHHQVLQCVARSGSGE